MDQASRLRAVDLARELIAAAARHLGTTREAFDAAMSAVDVGPREHRLRDGLTKLIEDRSVFEPASADAEAIRRDVFLRASAVRKRLEPGDRFDRDDVLDEIAADRATTRAWVEEALFADLRGAHRLVSFDTLTADDLVSAYERAQAQAVLLRAVKVTVDVRCASVASLRALFRQLKFLQLLQTIARTSEGYRIVIDGPFSLFDNAVRYGLKLALVLPAVEACDAWHLEADIRWGKDRSPLAFRLSGGSAKAPSRAPALPHHVRELATRFAALGTPWSVSVCKEILDLPGAGLTVPDLVFERRSGAARDVVYLEVMGYWSRDAVWKRVELVEAGLGQRILFAVSSKLRVSEAVLGGDLPGALYVYKGTMSARAVADRIERLAGATTGT
jgi:predicted nuclease of restriction endonuclease-like RecB superfamily